MPKRRTTKSRKKLTAAQRRALTQYKPQRGLTPAIHSFKRSIVNTIGLNHGAPPADWFIEGNNLYRNWVFKLSDLTDETDFTALFKYYRLKAVRIQVYFSNTSSNTRNAGSTASNQQMLCWVDINRNGDNTNSSGLDKTYLNSQTAKKKLCLTSTGRPLDIFMPLRQANMIYGAGAPSFVDYTLQIPKWLSTTEKDTPHYGHKMMLQRVDGQPFTSGIDNSQYAKIIQTIYLECRKVE